MRPRRTPASVGRSAPRPPGCSGCSTVTVTRCDRAAAQPVPRRRRSAPRRSRLVTTRPVGLAPRAVPRPSARSRRSPRPTTSPIPTTGRGRSGCDEPVPIIALRSTSAASSSSDRSSVPSGRAVARSSAPRELESHTRTRTSSASSTPNSLEDRARLGDRPRPVRRSSCTRSAAGRAAATGSTSTRCRRRGCGPRRCSRRPGCCPPTPPIPSSAHAALPSSSSRCLKSGSVHARATTRAP